MGRINRNSPLSLRLAIARQNPGMAKELGILPQALAPPPPKRELHKPKAVRVNKKRAARLQAAKDRVGDLPVSSEPLVIWLPGLRLRSLNTALGSGRKFAQRAGKDETQEAMFAYDGELWSFDVPVDVTFVQYAPNKQHQMDGSNLYYKPLLDSMRMNGGLGIVTDDRPDFVRFTPPAYIVARGCVPGVKILIRPAAALDALLAPVFEHEDSDAELDNGAAAA